MKRSWMDYGTAVLLALAGAAPGLAQQILLDRPVRVGELIAFPDLNDESRYYYVVDKPKLANSDSGQPQFSFLRYVENVRSGAGEAEIREGEGGGILHALVSLQVTEEQRRDAQRDLRRLDSDAELVGPIVFKSGRFGLVSSFTDPEGNLTRQVVGLGNAPLLDGEKAAVSMQLTKLGSKILWESFQTPTPDISFTFEMEMEGFRSPKRALIEADFDQVYEHEAFGAGVATQYLAAEIKAAFDDLRRQGAIKLTQIGEDKGLEALITTAYNKVADMMFQPLGGTGTPDLGGLASSAGGQASLLDRATTMLAENREDARKENEAILAQSKERAALLKENAQLLNEGAAELEQEAAAAEDPEYAQRLRDYAAGFRERSAGSLETANDLIADPDFVDPPTFAVVATYEMKRVRQRGQFRIDLNKYTADTLTLRFDENIGDLRELFENEEHFRQVNLDDPLYRQREIVAFVDGANAQDFGEFINFVTVQLRKRHEGGAETHDEVRIDRDNFNREGNAFKLLYGWKSDQNRSRWMGYEYKAHWSFFGGAEVDGPWTPSSSGAINLAPPYHRRTVTLDASNTLALEELGVRAIVVRLTNDLAGDPRVQQVTLNAASGEVSGSLDLLARSGDLEYDYEITWRLRGGKTLTTGRRASTDTLLFVDEIPGGAP